MASREALNPLYRSILAVLHRRINLTVEMGRTEVHSFVVDESRIDLNVAYSHSNTLLKLEPTSRLIINPIIGLIV